MIVTTSSRFLGDSFITFTSVMMTMMVVIFVALMGLFMMMMVMRIMVTMMVMMVVMGMWEAMSIAVPVTVRIPSRCITLVTLTVQVEASFRLVWIPFFSLHVATYFARRNRVSWVIAYHMTFLLPAMFSP